MSTYNLFLQARNYRKFSVLRKSNLQFVNTQRVVYLFEGDLCDANYVGSLPDTNINASVSIVILPSENISSRNVVFGQKGTY